MTCFSPFEETGSRWKTHMRGCSHSLSEWLSNISHPFRHPLSCSLSLSILITCFCCSSFLLWSFQHYVCLPNLPFYSVGASKCHQAHLGWKNHVWILSDLYHNISLISFNSFNEHILSPEQPIKASLISGPDRAATVYTSTSENKHGPYRLYKNCAHTPPNSLTAGFPLHPKVLSYIQVVQWISCMFYNVQLHNEQL